jgi:hypothetical protein
MLVRFMLLGYFLLSLWGAFALGQSTFFYSDGILIDTPYITYWLDYGVAQ